MDVEADAIATPPSQQLVRRRAEMLPGDVPQGDVDRTEGTADRRPPEVSVPVQVLPVVLDLERVLPEQVRRPGVDDALGGGLVAPAAPFPEPGDPVVGVDLQIHPSIPDQVRVDPFDPHRSTPSSLDCTPLG